MNELIYLIVVLGLIVLFFVSFSLFIKRTLIDSSIRKNVSFKNEEVLQKIIQQNEKIISLLEKEK